VNIEPQDSFTRAKSWVRELQRQGNPNIVIALAGNKSDLTSKRKVEAEEARQYAEENSIMFLETSAKTAANVNELFVQIARKLPKQAADAKPAQPQVWPKQESGRNWRCFRAR